MSNAVKRDKWTRPAAPGAPDSQLGLRMSSLATPSPERAAHRSDMEYDRLSCARAPARPDPEISILVEKHRFALHPGDAWAIGVCVVEVFDIDAFDALDAGVAGNSGVIAIIERHHQA